MEALLQDFRVEDAEKLKESLKAMTWLAMAHKGSQELYKAIDAICIDHDDLEVSGRSLQLLQQLLPECSVKISHLLPQIISKLGSPHSIISRTAFNCLHLASKIIPSEIVESLNKGLSHENHRVKGQCLRGISLLADHTSPSLIPDIIQLFLDPLLSTTAVQTARKLITIPKIRENIPESQLKQIEEGVSEAPRASSPAKKGDVPRIFDKELAHQIASSSDWKEKLMAMEEIRDNLPSMSRTFDKHLPSILSFLKQLLEGTSFRIINGALLLLQEILKIGGISKKADFSVLIPTCIEKLGDEKITFRNNSFKVFRMLLSELYPETLFPYFLKGLDNENWHIREGCLMLIMATILEQNKQYYYNYISIVNIISKLLSDPKAKIKQVAVETLVVIANTEGASQVLDRIDTDEVTLEKLRSRFRKKVIPVLREDSIELPKIIPSSAPVGRDISNNSSFSEITESPSIFSKALKEKLDPLAQSSTLPGKRAISINRTNSANKPGDNKADDSFMANRKTPVKAVDINYLKKEELAPVDNPELELQHYLRINPNDWAMQFEMLNGMRKLLKFHNEIFFLAPFHSLILQVIRCADSLRSSLSKNALIVLGEMCEFLSRLVEPELEIILNCLLRKSADTNIFISGEAEKSLFIVCRCVSEAKVVSVLIQCVNTSRSSQIKAKAALCFQKIFENKKNDIRKSKDLLKMMQVLSGFTREASAEVRTNAKSALNFLSNILEVEFDKYLKKILTNADFNYLKEVLAKPEAESPLAKFAKTSEVSAKSPVIRGRAKPGPVESIKENLMNGDWVRRVEALSKLKDLTLKSKLIDDNSMTCIILGLEDSDSRVSMHTLTVLSKIILCSTNKPDFSVVLSKLVNLLNSMNTLLRNNSKDVCRILMHQADLSLFLASMIKELDREKDKSWLFLFSLLIDSLQVIHSQRPSLTKKFLVPYGVKLLNEQPVSITAKKYLERLGSVVGDELEDLLGEAWGYYIKVCAN